MRQMALATLVLFLAPVMGRAQDSNDRWDDIKRLDTGRAVKITVGKDGRIAGTLLKVSGDELFVRRAAAEVALDRKTIRKIEVFSPAKRRRTMIIFGAIGMVAGIVPGAMIDEYANNETGGGGGAKPLLGAIGAKIGLLATSHSDYYTAYSAGASSVAPLSAVASFDQLDHWIGLGDKVYVTGSDGGKIAGRVDSMSATSLKIHAGGKRYELGPDQVQSISQRIPDSLTNGAIWGSLVGAGLGAGAAATQASHLGYRSSNLLISGAIGGLVGAGVGAIIDALHKGQKVIYSQPSDPRTTTLLRSLNVAPVLSRNTKGAAPSFSF